MIRALLSAAVLSSLLLSAPLAKPPTIPPVPVVSKEDICLAWVVDNEARGEPLLGQRAVLDVVQRRMEARNLTACQVVKQQGQFSGYKGGMKMYATEEMLQRLAKVRRIAPVASSATFFHSKDVRPTWASRMKKILTIGRHSFYAFRNPKEKKQ